MTRLVTKYVLAALLLLLFSLPFLSAVPPAKEVSTPIKQADEPPSTEKAQKLLQEDAQRRSDTMIAELKKLCEKHRCDVVARVIIQGNQINSEVVVTPRP